MKNIKEESLHPPRLKGQRYELVYSSSAVKNNLNAELGTIEKDASGYMGLFEKELFRGKK